MCFIFLVLFKLITKDSMNIHTITNTIFHSKTYILTEEGNNETWVIDCGDALPVIEYINTNCLSLKGIFITHSHFDHIYGLNDVVKKYPNVNIYTSEAGEKGLYNVKGNLSAYHEHPWAYGFKNIVVLTEQAKLLVFDKLIGIYATPGHDVSCLSFKVDSHFFTGDSYIPGIKTFTLWPLSDKQEAVQSEKRVLEIVTKENLIIKAGH